MAARPSINRQVSLHFVIIFIVIRVILYIFVDIKLELVCSEITVIDTYTWSAINVHFRDFNSSRSLSIAHNSKIHE